MHTFILNYLVELSGGGVGGLCVNQFYILSTIIATRCGDTRWDYYEGRELRQTKAVLGPDYDSATQTVVCYYQRVH